VLVLVEYRIAPGDVEGFLAAMAELRIVRRRLGATRWGVFQDVTEYGKVPGDFSGPFLAAATYSNAPIPTKADIEIQRLAPLRSIENRANTQVHPSRPPDTQWKRRMPALLASGNGDAC